ncbi:Aquaporin-12A [Armadillidium nasatum]|uniref:Aquaporin n=1 Tax=Armadillidium nasatum TaxID=96803 RepID=A0A5N5SNX7_9CRUS|nr:Aquaporin-12A [Armadillidium nasatum]
MYIFQGNFKFPYSNMSLSILISSLTILTQMTLSHIVRTQISKLVKHDLLREIILEIVASAELCGTCYELIIIADNYGVLAYALYLFLMTIWWSKSWGTATACPYNLLEEYVEQGTDFKTVGLKIGAQTFGGIASFRWVKQLWMLEMAATHKGRGVEDCSADLQVPFLFGFLIECVLTCFCRLFSRSLGELEPKFSNIIDSFFATSMVVLAFNYSGGYFNPVLATGLKWGCKGHSNTEHVVVYWAGSILGSMLSIKLWNNQMVKEKLVNSITPVMTKLKPSKEEEEKKED